MKDFFVSYTRADVKWAEWISWHLEEAGYTVLVQAWDFQAGESFVANMQKGATECDRTIAVLSPSFFESNFTASEWEAAFVKDPKGIEATLLPVRVRECDPPGLLSRIVYVDLTGLDEESAKKKLISGVRRNRKKPDSAPGFPVTNTHVADKQPRYPGVLPPICNLPHLRNPNFTGREEILTALADALTSGQAAALTQAVVGLGGVGKTQIAMEYAYRYAADYELIWWINSEEGESLAADYAALATDLNLPEKDLPEQEAVIAAVKRYLEQREGWLLIFDNAVTLDDVQKYLPRGAGKQVLITSRHQDWGSIGKSVSVKTWPRHEAIQFLAKRTGIEAEEAAGKLAEALGDLPLALEQAAAYLITCSLSCETYLALFDKRRAELWQRERAPAAYHQDTVATTWTLAMEEIEKAAPLGAAILNFSAWLAPDAVPRSLLELIAKHLPEEDLAAEFNDPLQVNEAIEALKHFSLIEVETEVFSIHRLVQAVVQDAMESAAKESWIAAALTVIDSVYPGDGYKNPKSWDICQFLLPHVLSTTSYADTNNVAPGVASNLLNDAANYLLGRANYADAEPLYRRALEISEAQLGADHPSVATSLNNLALLLKTQGKFAEAEPLYRRALEIRETQLGAEHPLVAASLNNLAALLQTKGKLAKAEPLYRRALEIEEAQLGPEHPDLAMSLNNLAELLREQGKYTEAEPLIRRGLEIYKVQLGPEHPLVAIGLNNLALLLGSQGKLGEAEPLHRRALEIENAQLGSEHPSVAISLNNLAKLLQAQGKLAEAEQLFRRALEILEQALGEDHPNTHIARNNLNELLSEMNLE